jgi:hypothetical protein
MSALAKKLPEVRYRLSYFPEAVALISLLLLGIFFSLAAPFFLTALSIGNILTFGSITGIVAIGVALLMITGEFDLSVGSNFAVAGHAVAPEGLAVRGQLRALVVCSSAYRSSSSSSRIPSLSQPWHDVATVNRLRCRQGDWRLAKGNPSVP